MRCFAWICYDFDIYFKNYSDLQKTNKQTNKHKKP